ncbi:MAG: hypothetical protein JSV52_09375 [Candidatus Zixiibacteriota bacterium]|nr:MAG: hypothetical protein JSV52_09375 [candidate division Zixibacteria bacterium]
MFTKLPRAPLADSCAIVALWITSILLFPGCSGHDASTTSSSLPELVVRPMTMLDTATEDDPFGEHKLVFVDAVPYATIDFSFGCNNPWMTLSNYDGTNRGVTSDSFAVTFSPTDLPVGVHYGTITVRSDEAANSPLIINVEYTIEPRLPELIVNPTLLAFSASTSEDILPPDTFIVICGNDSSAEYSLSEPAEWIELTGFSGTMPDTIIVGVFPAMASTGENVDTIWVSSENTLKSPQMVVINLTIRLPDLIVSPNNLIFSAYSHEETVPPDTFVVTCSNNSNADYSLSVPADWIELTGFSGTMPDTIVVSVDPAMVSASKNIDTIWISAVNTLESPQPVEVSLLIPSWFVSQVSPYPHPVNDVKFVDAYTGWAGGCVVATTQRDGFILGTNDGGETWEVRHCIWSSDLGEFFGISSIEIAGQTVWAVGESGIIRCGQNYGLDWESRSTGLADTVVTLADIEFVNEQIGWIVGEGGVILKTTDGGDTWQEQTSGTAANLYSVSFVDESNGWAAGSSHVILRTNDGGETWTLLTSELTSHRSVYFTDANNGWVVTTGGEIAHTSDGGNIWTPQQSNVSGWLNSIFFINNSIGWVAGQDGILLYTDDAGLTWNRQVINTDEWLYTVYFIDDSTGWCAGGGGVIFRTTSGGN